MTATSDQQKLQERGAVIGGIMRGATISLAVSIGVRLGIYKTMRGAGALTSAELANASGLHERWIREWLHGQSVAGIVDYAGGSRFELPPESAAFLADDSSLTSMSSMFEQFPGRYGLTPKVEESFRTGVGFYVDDRGKAGADALKALLEGPMANWHRQVLVDTAIPKFDGLFDRLSKGAAVADIGCGSGIAVLEMAKAFPNSTFHGYDNSILMLEAAAKNLAVSGLENVTFYNPDDHPMSASPFYDLILTLDCLHDMTNPELMAAAIRAALKPDGVWMIGEIRGLDSFEDNLRDNPGSAVAYSLSIFACLASSMAEVGSIGYGTLGLPEAPLRVIVKDAGFTRFQRIEMPAAVANVGPVLFDARP